MKKLLIFLIPLFFSCNESANSTIENSKPNILFIFVDDLGKEWVSSFGAEEITTPNIDALAVSGMKFHNFYSMPQCTPSRVSMLTAQYPFRHGWVNHWDVPRWGGGAHFDETVNPSLVSQIKAAGYTTAIAGKWQIDDFRVEPDALTRIGFDDYCMWTGYETGIPASGERYQNPYIFTKEGSKTYEGAFGPDVFKDFLVNFIQTNKEKPMFMYFPMVLPHGPVVNVPGDTASDFRGKYIGMVKYVDKITGELVQALEDAGIRDNTMIIWTTDNGSTQGMTGTIDGRKIKGGKSLTSENGINAPFIISWPEKVAPNQESNALIDITDLLPTCIDIVGGELENDSYTIDGQSFKNSILNNNTSLSRNWILSMGGKNNARLTENGVENQYVYRDRVLRTEQFKLYINSQKQAEKFIDLSNDPAESINLLDSLNSPERTAAFNLLIEVVKTFPDQDNDPVYKPNPVQAWDVEITGESGVWKEGK